MSNTAINIRIWYWHLQVTLNNEWSFKINRYLYKNHLRQLLKAPFAIYDFKPWEIRLSK